MSLILKGCQPSRDYSKKLPYVYLVWWHLSTGPPATQTTARRPVARKPAVNIRVVSDLWMPLGPCHIWGQIVWGPLNEVWHLAYSRKPNLTFRFRSLTFEINELWHLEELWYFDLRIWHLSLLKSDISPNSDISIKESDIWACINLKVRFQIFDFCFLLGYPILEGINHRRKTCRDTISTHYMVVATVQQNSC
jgi:hypothetical protein